MSVPKYQYSFISISDYPTHYKFATRPLGLFNQVFPQVNQIEINPFYQCKNLIRDLKAENVVIEAWTPFAEGKQDIFHHPTLVNIAQKYNKSVAQIIIRWLVEQDIVVLSKTVRPERMAENINIFDFRLTVEDQLRIAELDQNQSQFGDHETVSAVKRMKNSVFNI